VGRAELEILINRLNSLGYSINTFETYCKHKCYIASSMDHLKHMFIIPDDVEHIYDLSGDQDIYNTEIFEYMSDVKGALKVIGGESLISTQDIFGGCGAQSIDLGSFNTSNVIDMSCMFGCCAAHSLDLRSLNTSNVANMSYMFSACKAQSINLSSFNTSNVTNMSNMFSGCAAQSLDLRSFDTSRVTNMDDMFGGCTAQSLDLTSFNISNVTDMRRMFLCCGAQIKINDPKLKDQLQRDRR